MSLSLTVVKQGTAAIFNNVALVVLLITDVWAFGRQIGAQELCGSALVILFILL